jgi:hypothetical protein
MRADVVLMGKRINMAPRRYRRRLVVLIYTVFAALILAALCGYANMLLILAVVSIPRFLGGRSYMNGLVPPFMSGDERETTRRDHAYFQAYWWWDLTLLPALAAVGLKNNSFYAAWSPAIRYFVDHLPFGFLVAAAILYYTLPQAILLWTEPDMEEAR